MILRRLILMGAEAGALAASAVTCLVALLYALYAVLAPWAGAAGAEAIVFCLIALILAGAAAALWAMSRRTPAAVRVAAPTETLVERLSELLRERPVVVVAAAVGAGVLAVRNPRYLGSALRSLATPRVVED